MNDRRVNELVRMAIEVEDLEREAEGATVLRLVGARAETPVLRRGWWVGAGLAAAAAVAVAVVVPSLSNKSVPDRSHEVATTQPSSSHTPGVVRPPSVAASGTGVGHTAPTIIGEYRPDIVRHVALRSEHPGREIQYPVCAPAGSGKGCIVVAIYRDTAGGVPCVRIKPQACNEVSDHDLKCITLGQPCVPTVERGLVVALSGPQRALPKTESDAMSLASCILGTPRPCDNEPTCFADAAAECVSPEVSVRIETVASSR